MDARTQKVQENRYEIAQLISCLPDEPRYIGDQDVFVLQDKVYRTYHRRRPGDQGEAAAPTAQATIPDCIRGLGFPSRATT